MSDFEQLACDIEGAVGLARTSVEHFGYAGNPDDVRLAVSYVRSGVVSWLVGMEEARLGSPFRRTVIDKLEDQDDPSWPTFIRAGQVSPLKARCESLWGMRLAFTHFNGSVAGVADPACARWARDSPSHIPGAELVDDMLYLDKMSLHTPIRTIVQIREVLP